MSRVFSYLCPLLCKRVFSLFFLFSLFVTVLPTFSSGFGVYGGLNLGDNYLDQFKLLAVNQLSSTKNLKLSFSAGVYANFGLFRWSFPDKFAKQVEQDKDTQRGVSVGISLQTEIFYTEKGTLYTSRKPRTQIRSRYRFEYVEIPLFFKTELSLTSLPIHFYANVGASVAILQRASLIEINIQNQKEVMFDLKGQSNTLDVNVLGGLGASFELFTGYEIFLEGRYSFGLLDIDRNSMRTSFSFHRNIYVLFGMGIRI